MGRKGSTAAQRTKRKLVVASGYFNPLHYGHVSYLEKAKEAGDSLVVIVNNDRQTALKLGGDPGFVSHGMPARDRVRTVRSLACVDAAFEAVDEDESVCETLRLLHPDVFANGGRSTATAREAEVCRELGIEMIEGLGIEVLTLTPFTQHYDWGKPRTESLVAALAGQKMPTPSGQARPFAELWMGDHPSGPASVKAKEEGESDFCLRKTFSRTPSLLGPKLADEAKLPFLLKVLSIEKALSIQAHPDRALAERLHRERPNVYKDPNHKPEIGIALTDFEALCGFRPVAEIAHFLKAVPEFSAMVGPAAAEQLRAAAGDVSLEPAALKAAYSHMMHTADDVVREQLLRLLERTAQPLPEEDQPAGLSTCIMLVHRLHKQFGVDIGIFSVFFFNYAKMGVGECLYMPQNTPHAYLSGDIVECMATSDNVVRGGLTAKYKDIEVLCEMLVYRGGTPPRIEPVEQAPGVLLYADSELKEFQVTHIRLAAKTRRRSCFSNLSPAIAFACRGTGHVTISGEKVVLAPGVVFFLAAGVDADLLAEEELDVFAACCPPHYFNQ